MLWSLGIHWFACPCKVAAPQVTAVECLVDIEPVLMVIRQALADEFLAAVGYLGFGWKTDFSCVQNRLVFQN